MVVLRAGRLRAGRLCLVNSDMSSVLVYVMQALWVHCSICFEIDCKV